MTLHRFREGLTSTPARIFFFLAAMCAVAACGGGGGTSLPLPVSGVPAPASTTASQTVAVSFTIQWPQVTTSSARHRSYLGNGTKSITIAVDNGTAQAFNSPTLTPGSPAPTQTTTVTVMAPVGADTFTVKDYDALAGAGNLLASNGIPFTVVADVANNVPITLNGNLFKFGCAAIAPFVSGTTTLTLVGPAGQVQALPEDADSNIIVAPGTVPTVATLAPATATQAKVVAAPSGGNVFNVNVLLTGTAVSLVASGTNLAGTTVSGTACSITRVEALYVANQGPYFAGTPSLTIYPATATGNVAPIATISGSYTQQNEIQFPTVDSAGDIFLSNQGPMPGTPYGPTTGYVSIYAPATHGNVAPVGTITGFARPEGLAVDSSDDLFTLSEDRIQEFPAASDGVSAPAVATKTIAGSSTGLNSQYGLHLGPTGTIYTAGVNDIVSTGQVLIFAAGSSGNVAPIDVNPPGATAENSSSQSWIDVAPDASGNFFVSAFNNNLDFVEGFAAVTASGTGVPMYVGKGSATSLFSQPLGVYVDIAGNAPTGDIYVGNYGSNTIESFTSPTTLTAGVANTTLAGALTGLNNPFGIFVR